MHLTDAYAEAGDLLKRFDPSRTTLLRRGFERDIRRRLRAVRRNVVQLVAHDDAFGLPASKALIVGAGMSGPNRYQARSQSPSRAFQEALAPTKGRFAFKTSDQKAAEFNKWLAQQAKEGLLEVDPKTGKPWAAKHVQSAYKKGLLRGYTDARGKKLAGSAEHVAGAQAEFLRAAFTQPERMSKVRLLGTRAFEELKGISAEVSKKLNRTLANGIVRGEHPKKIAAQMAKEIDGLSKSRALRIARTEIIHAHAEGQLDSFEDLGVEEVGAQVEWSTAGDDKVCEECADLNGDTFTIAEARGKIPAHPNCRCAWIPVVEEPETSKSKKEEVEA